MWPLGDSYLGISQWGLNILNYDFCKLVYSSAVTLLACRVAQIKQKGEEL